MTNLGDTIYAVSLVEDSSSSSSSSSALQLLPTNSSDEEQKRKREKLDPRKKLNQLLTTYLYEASSTSGTNGTDGTDGTDDAIDKLDGELDELQKLADWIEKRRTVIKYKIILQRFLDDDVVRRRHWLPTWSTSMDRWLKQVTIEDEDDDVKTSAVNKIILRVSPECHIEITVNLACKFVFCSSSSTSSSSSDDDNLILLDGWKMDEADTDQKSSICKNENIKFYWKQLRKLYCHLFYNRHRHPSSTSIDNSTDFATLASTDNSINSAPPYNLWAIRMHRIIGIFHLNINHNYFSDSPSATNYFFVPSHDFHPELKWNDRTIGTVDNGSSSDDSDGGLSSVTVDGGKWINVGGSKIIYPPYFITNSPPDSSTRSGSSGDDKMDYYGIREQMVTRAFLKVFISMIRSCTMVSESDLRQWTPAILAMECSSFSSLAKHKDPDLVDERNAYLKGNPYNYYTLKSSSRSITWGSSLPQENNSSSSSSSDEIIKVTIAGNNESSSFYIYNNNYIKYGYSPIALYNSETGWTNIAEGHRHQEKEYLDALEKSKYFIKLAKPTAFATLAKWLVETSVATVQYFVDLIHTEGVRVQRQFPCNVEEYVSKHTTLGKHWAFVQSTIDELRRQGNLPSALSSIVADFLKLPNSIDDDDKKDDIK